MKIVTTREIQALDRKAIEDFKIDSLFLMENAGRAVAYEAIQFLNKLKDKKIAVFCGRGNNGGDGFVAARYLINKGFIVKIFLVGKVKEITTDAYANLDLLLKSGQKIIIISNLNSFKKQKYILRDYPLVIDALLGVGLRGDVREPFRTIIEFLNRSKKNVISVDVPSGLDATLGKPLGVCIRARKTVTFSLAKRGFFINQGPNFVGRLKVVDIGIPKGLIKKI
jgi:NAD(P)H-hydrate epimerase